MLFLKLKPLILFSNLNQSVGDLIFAPARGLPIPTRLRGVSRRLIKLLDRLSFKTATLQKHKHILAHQGTLAKADAQTHVHQFMSRLPAWRASGPGQDYKGSDHIGLTYDGNISEKPKIASQSRPR